MKCAVIPAVVVTIAAAVGCSDDKGESGLKTVTVTETTAGGGKKPPPGNPSAKAEATVAEHGFTQQKDTVVYGVVLSNPSSAAEAEDIEVTVNGVDERGNVAATDTNQISVIPPTAKFNVGGDLDIAKKDRVKELEVDVQTGRSSAPKHPLPKVSNVRVAEEEYGGLEVRAQVTNTLDSDLSTIADVFAVIRDAQGEIIGGAYTFPESDIRSGGRAAIRMSLSDSLPGAADADVSVDNEIGP